MALQPTLSLVLLCIEVSQWHTIRHTVGLLWTGDQPVAEARTTQDNTTHKHKRQSSMSSTGLAPATPATKRSQTYALGSAAIGTGGSDYTRKNNCEQLFAEHGKVDCTRAVTHTVVAYEKYYCLKFCKQFNVNIQLKCHSTSSFSRVLMNSYHHTGKSWVTSLRKVNSKHHWFYKTRISHSCSR
jgi:hypothetical protein